MHIDFPGDLRVREQLILSLRKGFEQNKSHGDELTFLLDFPYFAQDEEIHSLITNVLASKWLGYRISAALILEKIGDPAGILHITYNCLTTHPILNVDQRNVSGRHNLVSRYASQLTDECISLLIGDLENEGSLLFGDPLSQLLADRIVPRMLPLLGMGGWPEKNAAYVLAIKGYDIGLNVLDKWIHETENPIQPIRALIFSAPSMARNLAEEYSDPRHPLYIAGDFAHTEKMKRQILPLAKLAKDMMSRTGSLGVSRILEKHYSHRFHQVELYERSNPAIIWKMSLEQPLEIFVRFHPTEPALPETSTIMARCSTVEDREYCQAKQEKQINALLDMNHLDFFDLYDGKSFASIFCPNLPRTGIRTYYGLGRYNALPDVRIVFDKEDYVRAATDWLIFPELWQEVL